MFLVEHFAGVDADIQPVFSHKPVPASEGKIDTYTLVGVSTVGVQTVTGVLFRTRNVMMWLHHPVALTQDRAFLRFAELA